MVFYDCWFLIVLEKDNKAFQSDMDLVEGQL